MRVKGSVRSDAAVERTTHKSVRGGKRDEKKKSEVGEV